MDALQRFPFILRIKPRYWLLVIAVALVAMSTASARDDADNPRQRDDLTPAEISEPEKPEAVWKEDQTPLPPFPSARDLIPFRADMGDPDYTYYIDVNSVSFTADEVMRYTVIIKSPTGSSNIIYEGFRCATQEVKMFAFGTRGGQFRRMVDPQWTYFYIDGVMGYRASLFENLICDENGWSVDSDTVLERLVLHDPRRTRFAPKTPEEAND